MTVLVTQSTTQSILFNDTKETGYGIPGYCGPRTFTFTGGQPSFLQINAAGTILTLSTNNVADVGPPRTIQFAVGFANYPSVPKLTKQFIVSINCQVFGITFQTAPALITIETGNVTPQPALTTFIVAQSPACGHLTTFAFVGTSPDFVSLANQQATQVDVQVFGALLSDKNIYPLTLRASINGIIADATCNLDIADPCRRAIFQPISDAPISDMTLIRNFDSVITQTFIIKTDIEINYGLLCAYTVSPWLPPAYLTLTGLTIALDEQLTTPVDVGPHLLYITAVSADYPGSVAIQNYPFVVTIQHCVVNMMSIPSIPMIVKAINMGPLSSTFSPVVWNNLACLYTATYSVTYSKSGSGIIQPTWITFTGATQTITVDPTLQAEIGLYDVVLTATIPQPTNTPTGVKSVTRAFQIRVTSDCEVTALIPQAVSNIVARVSQPAANRNVFMADSISQARLDPVYCGARTYSLSPTYGFLSISGDLVVLQTSTVSDSNSYPVTVTIALATWPMVPSISISFTAIIECEVLINSIVVQPSTITIFTIGVDLKTSLYFSFTEFPACGLTYSLNPTLPFTTLDLNAKRIDVYSENLEQAGTYNMVLAATPVLGIQKTAQFELKMLNKCSTTRFLPHTIKSLAVFKQDPEFNPLQTIVIDPFRYEAKEAYNIDCGEITSKIVYTNNTDAPNWVRLEDSAVKVDFSRIVPSSTALRLITWLRDYTDIMITTDFTVSLSSSDITCLPNAPQSYLWGHPPLIFGIQMKNQTVNFGVSLTPVKTAVTLDESGNVIDNPSFLGFSPASNLFTIQNAKPKELGSYTIGLRLGFNEYPLYEVMCTTKLNVSYKKQFTGEQMSDQTIPCKQDWSVTLPSMTDAFGTIASIRVDLNDLQSTVSWDEVSQKLSVIDPSNDLPNGSHIVRVSYMDLAGYSESYTFKIIAECTIEVKTDKLASSWAPPPPLNNPQVNPPKPFVEWINQMGEVRVSFDRRIVLPTFTLYPEFRAHERMRQYCNETVTENCVQTRRLEQTQEEKRKEAIEIVNRGLVHANDTVSPILDLMMIPGLESDIDLLSFTWKCIDFQPTFMDFIVSYSRYQDVSIHQELDSLEVRFVGNQYFRSEDTNEFIEQSVAIVKKSVPTQVNPSTASVVTAATSAVSNSSQAFIIVNFVISFFAGGALQQLFTVIRKLTIMVHLLLVDVKIPANAQFFFKGLLKFVKFDVLDFVNPYLRHWLNLAETVELDNNFVQLGYESSYFILNMSTLFLVMIYFALMLIFYAATLCLTNPKIVKCRNKMMNGLVWNQVICFITESFMVMAVCTVTNLSQSFIFTSFGTFLNSNLTMIGVIIILGFPLFALMFLLKYHSRLSETLFKDKYGELYKSIRTKQEGKAVLFEPFIASMRILVLSVTFVMLQGLRYWQLFIVNASVTFIFVYVGLARPYAEKDNAFFQQFNECFIMITNYHLMCFADFIPDEPTRTTMGWSLIAFVTLNLLINICYIMFGGIKKGCRSAKIKYYNWKISKLKTSIRAKHKQNLLDLLQAEAHQKEMAEFKHLFEASQNEDLRKVPDHVLNELLNRQKNQVEELFSRQKHQVGSSQVQITEELSLPDIIEEHSYVKSELLHKKKHGLTLVMVKTRPGNKSKVGVMADDRKDQKDDRQENKQYLIQDAPNYIQQSRRSPSDQIDVLEYDDKENEVYQSSVELVEYEEQSKAMGEEQNPQFLVSDIDFYKPTQPTRAIKVHHEGRPSNDRPTIQTGQAVNDARNALYGTEFALDETVKVLHQQNQLNKPMNANFSIRTNPISPAANNMRRLSSQMPTMQPELDMSYPTTTNLLFPAVRRKLQITDDLVYGGSRNQGMVTQDHLRANAAISDFSSQRVSSIESSFQHKQSVIELDDNLQHTTRVASRMRNINSTLTAPDESRRLFDLLWRPQ